MRALPSRILPPALHGKKSLSWPAAIIGSVLVVLVPAFWNGFPFMFYDTTSFIEQAVRGGFRAERSVFYAWFLAAFWPSLSLWPAVAAQTFVTVLVTAAFANLVAPGVSPARFFAMIVLLSIATGLPWYAGQVLPDILAPLLVLCLYLLGFHSHALAWPGRMALVAVAVLAATSHASHLALAAGLAGVIVFLEILAPRAERASARPRWRLPALVFGLSLAAVVASNFVRTGEVFINRSGPAFVFGRLLQDGIVQRLLDDTCPESGFRLCAYKDKIPATASAWLWSPESPFREMGGFAGTAEESSRVITASLRRYPLLNLKMALSNTAVQFASFATGDGIEPQIDQLAPILENYAPRQSKSYLAARQQNNRITFSWVNALHVPVGGLSLIAIAVMLAGSIRRRYWDDRAFLPAFLLLALLGNAVICGVLSNPHDRYQSRLIWPVTLGALLLFTAHPWGRAGGTGAGQRASRQDPI